MKSIEDAYIKMVSEKMDPVDAKELKGKHTDRDDKDIDNDGDVDSSDKYLHKRRKAITKSMKEAASQAMQSMAAKNKQSRSKMDNDDADAASDDWVATDVTGQKPDAKDMPVDKDDHHDKATNDSTKVADKIVAKGGKRPSDNQDGDKFQKLTQKEEVDQIDELSVKTLTSYNNKASKDPSRAKMNNKAVGKIVKKTMQGEEVEQVDVDEAMMPTWTVELPALKKKVPVRARNSQEAIKKAAKRAGVDWKTVKLGKVQKEEVDQVEEGKYQKPTAAEIAADKKKDMKGKPRPSVTASSLRKKVYGEEAEHTDEAKVPANYAAMMAKKRKKAGTSEFGRHPDKKKEQMKESHFAVGDKVKCKASGMSGKIVKVDPSEEGKYYTVEKGDGKQMKYAPNELMKEGRTLSDVLDILNR